MTTNKTCWEKHGVMCDTTPHNWYVAYDGRIDCKECGNVVHTVEKIRCNSKMFMELLVNQAKQKYVLKRVVKRMQNVIINNQLEGWEKLQEMEF